MVSLAITQNGPQKQYSSSFSNKNWQQRKALTRVRWACIVANSRLWVGISHWRNFVSAFFLRSSVIAVVQTTESCLRDLSFATSLSACVFNNITGCHSQAVVRKNLVGIMPQSSRVDIRDEARPVLTSS
jgi:hypothetical protein